MDDAGAPAQPGGLRGRHGDAQARAGAGVFGKREIHTHPLARAGPAHRDLEARIDGAAIVLVP